MARMKKIDPWTETDPDHSETPPPEPEAEAAEESAKPEEFGMIAKPVFKDPLPEPERAPAADAPPKCPEGYPLLVYSGTNPAKIGEAHCNAGVGGCGVRFPASEIAAGRIPCHRREG